MKVYTVWKNCVRYNFLIQEKAEAFAVKHDVEVKVSDSKKDYELYPTGTPFLQLDTEGLVNVGEVIVDSIRNTRQTAYTTPDLVELAKEQIARSNKGCTAQADRYYSRPWV